LRAQEEMQNLAERLGGTQEAAKAKMKAVTLSVADRQAVKQRALKAFSGKRRDAHISFASADLLWKVLTAKRWELLKAMAGGGAMTRREAARRVGRDVRAVHGDVHALLTAGVLRKNADGKIEFPFDAVHVDFVLKAA
jgi:predicted transcriptional regulator